MAFRWFDESHSIPQLRPQRQAFHDRIAAQVEQAYPGAIEEMLVFTRFDGQVGA